MRKSFEVLKSAYNTHTNADQEGVSHNEGRIDQLSLQLLMQMEDCHGNRQRVNFLFFFDLRDRGPRQKWSENPAHRCLARLNPGFFQSEHGERSHQKP